MLPVPPPPISPKGGIAKGNQYIAGVGAVTENKDNKCYLHVERVDDKFIAVDDLGRQVAMTRAVSVRAEYNGVTEITLRFLDANKDNKPHINNINSDLMMEKLTVNEFTGEVKDD